MRIVQTCRGPVVRVAVADDGRVGAATEYRPAGYANVVTLIEPGGSSHRWSGQWPLSFHFPAGGALVGFHSAGGRVYRPGRREPAAFALPSGLSLWLADSDEFLWAATVNVGWFATAASELTLSRWRVEGDSAVPVGGPTRIDEPALETVALWPDGSKLLLVRRPPDSVTTDNREGVILALDGSGPAVPFRHRYDIAKPQLVAPGGRAVVGHNVGRIVVYDIPAAADPVAVLKAPGRRQFAALAFHPSGRLLAACAHTAVTLYDTATWGEVACYEWSVGKARSVAFSPDGALAAVGGDGGKIAVWDVDF